MKFALIVAVSAFLSPVRASILRLNLTPGDEMDAIDAAAVVTPERRLGDPRWEKCPVDGGDWLWNVREQCINGQIVCKTGWKKGDVKHCGVPVDECTETAGGSPCGTAACVDLDPDAGQYKCVCSEGNGSQDLGFGPTSCSDSCVSNPSLCDLANSGFCTTNNNGGSFYCTCPSTHTDVKRDGSLCQLIPVVPTKAPTRAPTAEPTNAVTSGTTGVTTGGTTGTSCATLTCPTGQICGTTGTGGAVCVDCPQCTGTGTTGRELVFRQAPTRKILTFAPSSKTRTSAVPSSTVT